MRIAECGVRIRLSIAIRNPQSEIRNTKEPT